MKIKNAILSPMVGLALVAVGTILPLFPMGCSNDKSCIVWNSSQGACPAPLDAMRLMQPECGAIKSVDNEGEFIQAEGICCYAVTISPNDVVCTPQENPSSPPPDSMPTGPGVCGIRFGNEDCIANTPCCDILRECHDTQGCQACMFDQICKLGSTAAALADEASSCIWKTPCRGELYVNYYRAAACDTPPPPGNSGGACVAKLDGKNLPCNIVTQTGCETGEVCRRLSNGSSECAAASAEKDGICSPCGATGSCPAGYGCLTGFCARYCCDDNDCGTGICKGMTLLYDSAPVRYCVDKYGGELGGMGGAGGGEAGSAGAGGM